MALSAEIKKRLADAKVTGGGSNINHGRYIFMIKKWWFEQGYKGLADKHELVVMKAEKITVMEGDKKVEVEPNPVGSTCSAVYNYDGKAKVMAPINTKKFLFGLLGIEEKDITPDDANATLEECINDDSKVGPVNPCRGMLIACETYPIYTKESKQWIVGTKWECVSPPGEGENTDEKAKARFEEHERALKAMASAAAPTQQKTAQA